MIKNLPIHRQVLYRRANHINSPLTSTLRGGNAESNPSVMQPIRRLGREGHSPETPPANTSSEHPYVPPYQPQPSQGTSSSNFFLVTPSHAQLLGLVTMPFYPKTARSMLRGLKERQLQRRLLCSVCVGRSRQTFNNRQNSTPPEQRSTDPSAQFQIPASLRFDYHSRCPSSSPPTTQRSPNSLSSSPPLHSSLHRTNGSSSAGSLSMTPPPLSAVAHPHRGVDQSSNHRHVELSSLPPIQRKPPSITQLPWNPSHPELGTLRRHALDSGYVLDPQTVSGGRKRTLSILPSPISKPISSPHSSPLPPPNPRRENTLL